MKITVTHCSVVMFTNIRYICILREQVFFCFLLHSCNRLLSTHGLSRVQKLEAFAGLFAFAVPLTTKSYYCIAVVFVCEVGTAGKISAFPGSICDLYSPQRPWTGTLRRCSSLSMFYRGT